MKYIIRPPLSTQQQEKRSELDDFGEKMGLVECKIGHKEESPLIAKYWPCFLFVLFTSILSSKKSLKTLSLWHLG